MAAEQAREVHVPYPQQHEDPMAETRHQFLQGLATMATVGEAGARWAAVGIQNKAADRERQARRDQATAAARREADRLAAKVRADRERMAASLDGDWLLNKATFAEAAAVWRTATIHAGTDPVARRAADFAEQRLRQFRPDLMAAYERRRQAGSAIPEAMRAAAQEVWENDARAGYRQHGARAHGGTRDRQRITPDGPAAVQQGGREQVDDFDAAVRKEAMTLAEHVRPEALDELQRQWRANGKLPAGEPVQLLRDLAAEMSQAIRTGDAYGQPVEGIRLAHSQVEEALARDLHGRAAAERGEGVRDGGMPDDPRTLVNEHATGETASVVHDDNADHTAATASVHHAEVLATPAWTQAFPKLRIAQVNAVVVAKQSAAATTAVQMRGRAR
ncbi:F0F1-type ATP synthase membrane subunit b/b' [Micromonospora sp. HB375]|uniref:hypothetical protein n=1 Tax=unclassified Micromonospora TaxID=2617518 RepID=UPI001AE23C63|nr:MULTISPECIES: hypothetical protein [unclassified Micromonospora]MBP1782712.1 F0F1-type ATP synthase membrane subunit b/b' [Micromonospora sp. HB375]